MLQGIGRKASRPSDTHRYQPLHTLQSRRISPHSTRHRAHARRARSGFISPTFQKPIDIFQLVMVVFKVRGGGVGGALEEWYVSRGLL